MNILTEAQARKQERCLCGGEKTLSAIVCWPCFKDGERPLKNFPGTFEEWQQCRRFPAGAGELARLRRQVEVAEELHTQSIRLAQIMESIEAGNFTPTPNTLRFYREKAEQANAEWRKASK